MNQAQYNDMLSFMRACACGPAHGEAHVMRVANAALEIAAGEENVDRDRLLCACLLHDIGRPEQNANPALHHAAVGAEKAQKYLAEHGFSPDFAAAVAEIIRAHSSAALAGARGIEAQILFDADKLDTIGAIGAFRSITYGLEMGEPLYDECDLFAQPSPGGRSILREVENDLNFALSSFLTRTGRALAAEKADFSRAFLAALRREMRRGTRFPAP